MRCSLFVRSAIAALALALPLTLGDAGSAQSDKYPSRPITIIVPYTPGGSVDLLARALGQRMTADWGQPVNIDNRPGAGGSVGAAAAAHAPGDGYTLFMSTNAPLTTNLALYPNIGYDTLRDFAPIIMIGGTGTVFAVNPSFAAKTLADLVKIAKQKPEALSVATSGNGSTADLTVAEFNRVAGIKLRAVPYAGGVPSLTAALSGEVPIVFSDLVPAMPYIQSGKLRALAMSSADRAELAPQIPTVAESGYPGFDLISWVGLLAPHGTSPAIVRALYAEVEKTIVSPLFQAQLKTLNMKPVGYDPARFEAFIKTEIPRWRKIVETAKLQIQ